MSPEAAIALYAEFTALPGKGDDVSLLVGGLAKRVRAEPGNVTFVAYRKRATPNDFFVYEEYADESAFRAHLSYEHGVTFNKTLEQLVVGGLSRVILLDRI